MYSELPLHSRWSLDADELPERLLPKAKETGFFLPGTQALADFADLLGTAEDTPDDTSSACAGVPFMLPAMLPDDVRGKAVLSREIDFGRLRGKRAQLYIPHLCGRGSIALDDRPLCRFGKSSPQLTLDLSDALRLGRKKTLSICFDDAKDAGLPGGVFIKTTGPAHFEDVILSSCAARTLTAAMRIHAKTPGHYAVRAALVPCAEETPWRESRLNILSAGEAELNVSFSLHAPRFSPGTPYQASMLKLELYALSHQDARRGLLCDVLTLMAGHPGFLPRVYLPLTREECRLNPDALIARANEAGISALFLPAPASDLLYRLAAMNGISLMSYAPDSLPTFRTSSFPCASQISGIDAYALREPSPAAACVSLCAASGAQPTSKITAEDDELLWEATGRHINPADPAVQQQLEDLSALALRLRAEAARQGQYAGPLCWSGAWQKDAFFSAIRTANRPVHLSALPLRGAWYADSRFSASLHLFIPKDAQSGTYSASAQLVSEEGHILAELSMDCPICGGSIGVLEALLPGSACVLKLKTQLKRSGAVIESDEIPVYVGLRGPLEAAF